MKRNIILLLTCITATFIMLPSFGQGVNKLSAQEKKDGWVLLFNGSDFSGWRQCNGADMPKNWMIEDDAMKVFTGEGRKPGSGAGGDILFGDKKFKNFELSIDWKASKMANSGIFFNIRGGAGQTNLLCSTGDSGSRQCGCHRQYNSKSPCRFTV